MFIWLILLSSSNETFSSLRDEVAKFLMEKSVVVIVVGSGDILSLLEDESRGNLECMKVFGLMLSLLSNKSSIVKLSPYTQIKM